MLEKEEIGKKIKILRKTRGLTQQELADRLNIKRATISNYEIGRRSPHMKELEEIARVLNVDLSYFGFGGSPLIDLIARAKVLFENENITPEEKEKAYKEIMKLYLKMEE